MKYQCLTLAGLIFLGASLPAPAAAASATWSRDPERAFELARSQGKLLLVDVYADWCGWCKVLEKEVFPDPAFRAVAKDFVLLRIDAEDGGAGSLLAAEHRADALPTLLILEPGGARVGEVQGYAPAPEFVARLKSQLAIWDRVLEGYRTTLRSGDSDALRRTAVDFYERRDGARAASLLERLLEQPSGSKVEEVWTRVLLADSWRLAGDLESARAAARQAREAAAAAGPLDDPLAEKLDLLAFWIAESAGECGAAKGALAEFEHSHPRSLYLAEARQALRRLSSDSEARCS